jgi:hypothetical protein
MGPQERIRRFLRTLGPEELQTKFPKLVSGSYQRKSLSTPRYNCVGFANKDERHWWEAGRYGGRFYWPPHVKQSNTVDVIAQIFISDGYTLTDNQEIEPGWEKIAIYVSLEDMEFSHVARSDGEVWKSKLGKGQDIDHHSLSVLEGDNGDEYGIVDRILKRRIE